jgi:subtilisin family serine protease
VGAGRNVIVERPGYITFTLRPGEALSHVPAHLDYLSGAGRPVARMDGGPIDRALRHRSDGFRALTVFHARRSLNVPGEQHSGFDALEEQLGFSRSYRARLADPAATPFVVDRLRALPVVESAAVQTLATAPFAATVEAGVGPPPADAMHAPYELVRAPEALALEPGDERVTVACVDSGVSLGHAELQRKLLAGYDTVDLGLGAVGGGMRLLGDSRGVDFTAMDDVGHGSLVASVMGAQGWRMPKGVAGRALMLPIRVLAAARAPKARLAVGVGGLPDIAAGMKVAVDLGAHVINMSFGTRADQVPEGAPTPHAPEVAYATHYGCVLVAAAGNSGARERFYPAALPEVIAVGSVDLNGRRSPFSTYGDHVDIAAPGERIYGADRHGYRAASGTSFAAPFVAAAAALVLARARRRRHRCLGPEEVRGNLVAAAHSLAPAPNPETGHGLLDVAGALRHLDAQEALP